MLVAVVTSDDLQFSLKIFLPALKKAKWKYF